MKQQSVLYRWTWNTLPYAALLAGWAVGLWHLGRTGFWYDEFFNADLVLGHTLREFLTILRTQQPYPPLYYLMLKAWSVMAAVRPYAPALEPSSGIEFLLRFPSVAGAVLLLAALVALGRALRLRTAVWLPFLLAVHPTLLWYARDARLYTWWLCWVLLALAGLVRGRRGLWVGAGAAALLTHYFSLFPLGAAAGVMALGTLGRARQTERRWSAMGREWAWLALPFLPALGWGLLAFRVTTGFQSFATGSPPGLTTFLTELGPELILALPVLQPLGVAPAAGWGYGLLALGALGLLLWVMTERERGLAVALALILGAAGIFVLWQLRPVHQSRYLLWALPLTALGAAAALELPWRIGRRLGSGDRFLGMVGLLALAGIGAVLWSAPRSQALVQADPTLWYPDFRSAVAFMNERAQPGDRGLAIAAHGVQLFSAYGSLVPFTAGPAVGERARPEAAVQLLEAIRPDGGGRRWLLFYQEGVVDPSALFPGTLEAAGGYRVEMFYTREARLFAYTLPDDQPLQPLTPTHSLTMTFTNGLALRGFTVHREERLIPVYLFWELGQSQPVGLVGAVHLARQPGIPPFTQQDKPVLNEYWPLPHLPTGELLADRYELVLPVDLPPGTYYLSALLYDPQTMQRVLLVDGEDRVELGEFTYP